MGHLIVVPGTTTGEMTPRSQMAGMTFRPDTSGGLMPWQTLRSRESGTPPLSSMPHPPEAPPRALEPGAPPWFPRLPSSQFACSQFCSLNQFRCAR